MNIERRVTEIMVIPEGEKLFSEMATKVSIEDECGGEFVVVRQSIGASDGEIRINPEEWPALRDVMDEMIAACRPDVVTGQSQAHNEMDDNES